MVEKIVPDTSVIINGTLSEMASKGEITGAEIIIPEFVISELQAQAGRGLPIGIKGLNELKRLGEFRDKLSLSFKGRRQTMEEIKLAKSGRVDALIIDLAKEENATLYTCDMVQSLVAEVQGVSVKYFKPYVRATHLKIEEMLTPDTLSLHLKDGAIPMAKRGKPGSFKLEKVRENPITSDEIENIIKEILDAARYEEDSFIEMGDREAMVIQLGNLRIAIARPPFSDGDEITIVKPVAKLSIEDYNIPDSLRERIKKGSGIILAGPPGSGKSTFAASIAEFYESQGYIVKTMEQPRDLQVRKEITQYTKLKGDFERTAEMLLLVRPDYTIYDEVRTTKDFNVFTDMRLSGIGMVGVVHANEPIDAIQRFIRRLELGMIPHIIDTLVFIHGGKIEKVYRLSLEVRVPTGMTESDLARPIVNINDFFSSQLEYEIYSYGEENVIIPIKESKEGKSPIEKLAAERIRSEIRRIDDSATVEISGNRAIIRADNDSVAKLIGKKGAHVQELEKRLGISIDIMPRVATMKKELHFEHDETGGYILLKFSKNSVGEKINAYDEDDFLMSAAIGKGGQVKISKNSDIGKAMLNALLRNSLKVFG